MVVNHVRRQQSADRRFEQIRGQSFIGSEARFDARSSVIEAGKPKVHKGNLTSSYDYPTSIRAS